MHVLSISCTVENNYIPFQQDNAQPIAAIWQGNCLQAGHVNTIVWPSRFYDLSPIEHLWNILGQWVRDLYPST